MSLAGQRIEPGQRGLRLPARARKFAWPRQWANPALVAWRLLWAIPYLAAAGVLVLITMLTMGPARARALWLDLR